jgi:hypothetical protein
MPATDIRLCQDVSTTLIKYVHRWFNNVYTLQVMSIQTRINDTIFIRLWFNCYYFRDRYNNRCDIHSVLVPRVLSPHLLKDGSKYSYYSFLPKVYIFPSDLRGII